MNNTLTGLGLALVLALVAALIGPWFVNWTAYRDDFARQASALVGAPVTVSGAVDARLLPTPYVRFRNIHSGAGATRLAVDEVEIELAIAPLLRGEFKAERVKLVRPKLGVEATADGAVRTAFSAGRAGAAERVSFDRAEIIDGEIALKAPWGASALGAISGFAEAGSLAGPYKFEGSAGPQERRIDLRLATARADASGALRVKLSANEAGRRTTLDADGLLKLAARPGFEGRVAITRPARRDARDGDEIWSASGSTKLEAGRLTVEALDLVYGPEDRAVRIAGSGAASLANGPRIDLRLESRQLDFDRLLGDGRPRTPAGVLAEIASRLPGGFAPPVNGSFSLDARGVVLAGDVVRDLRLDLEAQNGKWRVRRGGATLPGEARTALSGALAFAGAEPGFVGQAEFEAADLSAFRRWLAGGRADGATPVRRFAVKGEVSARPASVIVEKAEIATDGARSTGRIAWTGATENARAQLQAALVSDRLDLDALGLDRMLGQALGNRDMDAFVALDAKTLVVWGLALRDVSVDGSLDRDGLDLKRFEVRDASGARMSGAGRLTPGAGGLEGRLGFKVAGPSLTPLLAIARAGGVAPAAVEAIETRAGAIAPVDLQIDVDARAGERRMTVAGSAAGGRIDARLSAPELSFDAPTEIDVKLASPDGRRLAALAGFGVSPLASAKGGDVTVRLSGAPARGMAGEARFSALGAVLAARGNVAVAPVAGLSAQGEATFETGDLAGLAAALGRATPLSGPAATMRLAANVGLSADGLRLDELKGEIGGRAFSGRASAPLDPSKPMEGRLAFEELPVQALAALAFSPEAFGASGDGSAWPNASFGPSPLSGLLGRFEVTAARMPLAGRQVASDVAFALALKRDGLAMEGLAATLYSGRLSGAAGVTRSEPEATASLALALSGAAAETLLGFAPAASPLLGTTDLKIEAQGTGRSLSSLVGALTGAGQITLSDGLVRRLDPAAIDRIEPQIEAGLALEAPKVAGALAREFGAADLRMKRASASFTMSGGVMRSGGLDAEADGVRLGGSATLDLRRLVFDADLSLQPARPEAPQVSVAFKGPLAAPVRVVEATSFTGWLSIRAVERETRRIEAMEADARERARLARERQEEERKRAEAEKARLEAERRKAEAERKKREAETRALIESLPRPAGAATQGAIDVTTPPAAAQNAPVVAPPAGVFAPQGQASAAERHKTLPDAPLPAPQSILPPAAATPR
ncbi:AsmA family protein [Chenggangzhangella methanolivorans]|uniref:AsmA family protein n=1 Tax=Chenggangzhangella methanolivorans TaxID=1437009 RepID=A0A9E6RG24_9HYPH|nr:AsmA family protein [Chenggangzhangella methanolivorans]QZO00726.1 AsmA family protein [Chenggangzhangella methanolivorans]